MSNLKAAREAAKMSQKEVALTLKVSAPTVSDWEAEKIKPSADNLMKLSELYNRSINYLLNKPLHSNQPINMLCCMYDVSASELSQICKIDYETAECWANGRHDLPDDPHVKMYPQGEMAERIASFFEVSRSILEEGYFFPDVLDAVKAKIISLRKNGKKEYNKPAPFDLSEEAVEIGRAYDQATSKDQGTVRAALADQLQAPLKVAAQSGVTLDACDVDNITFPGGEGELPR